MSFFHTLFITAYSTNIGIHIASNIRGDSSTTGIVTAINAGFALLIGISFSKISLIFKQYTMPFSIFVGGMGFLAITLMKDSMAGILLASACCGISLSCFMAQASYMISTSVNQVAIALASGVFALVGGIGGLTSPIVLNEISKGVFKNQSTNSVFLICMVGLFLLFIYSLVSVKLNEKREIKLANIKVIE
ncbi:Major Facilitator Superfamily protein [compost metagenome]